jgi:periplasmic protein TonB
MTQKPVFVEGVFTLRNLRSMGAAAVVEILLALGIAAVLIWQQMRPAVPLPPPVADPIVDFQQPLPMLQRNIPIPRQPEQTAPLHQVQAVPTDVPTPTTEPVQAPRSPLSPAQQSQASADVADDFSHMMLRAINQQKVYPKLQLVKGVTGETEVAFDYVDGVVSDVHVVRSSGSYELDQAAMRAVQQAVLPPKPAELAGLDHYVFTLAFDLGH